MASAPVPVLTVRELGRSVLNHSAEIMNSTTNAATRPSAVLNGWSKCSS